MPNYSEPVFYGPVNSKAFLQGIQHSVNQLPSPTTGVFIGDQLFTIGRNLSFLENERFMTTFKRHAQTSLEKSVIWRTYVLAWAAERGMKLTGDFVECGAYKGISARILADYLNFKDCDKRFYLYDLFEHSPDMNHHNMPEHGEGLYDQVCARFGDLDNVSVIKGSVPDTLSESEPKKIAFLHIDMNNAEAELGALKTLFGRVCDGAFVVLDDYGWLGYRQQKIVEDEFFSEAGYQVLELPTGQGLVIK